MDMRIGDRDDAQAFRGCDRVVGVDIALRVDDNGFTSFLATNHIGVLSQLVIKYLSEKHDLFAGLG
jgi:hypothetical protein